MNIVFYQTETIFSCIKMKSAVLYIYLLLLFINSSFSAAIESDSKKLTQWLPKCCPEEKVISSDGKSCVRDPSLDFSYNASSTDYFLPADVLTVSLNNESVQYKLVHKTKFNCVRHELYVVGNDIYVTPDNDVVVFDDYGDNWTLSTSEMCVDSVVQMPSSPELLPTRMFFALLCPSCQGVVCLHKCCDESERLLVNEDGTKVDCVPSSEPSWSQQSLDKTSRVEVVEPPPGTSIHRAQTSSGLRRSRFGNPWGDTSTALQPFAFDYEERIFVFHGFPECPRSLYLEYPEGPVQVGPHGSLLLQHGVAVPRVEYCGDYSGGSQGYALLACRQTLPLTAAFKPTLYGALLCVGAAFLALTLGLHLWLPELRASLHSRVLLAHVSCLLAAFLGLAAADLAYIPAPSVVCSATAFFIQFSILAAIFWLNVMCVDIAWTFSGFRAPRASLTLDSDGRKYVYYSLYAWGSTCAICGLTVFLEYGSILPIGSRIKPGFGITSCWFRYWESILLLVYGPMGVLLLINVGLFIYTAIKIRRSQQDTAAIVQHAGSKLREDRDRFSLYLKLFCLMGVTWMFELVSWIVGGSDSYWYITDVINALRGVFIFTLFCLKKKVITLIKAKFKKKPKFPRHPRKSTSSKMSSSMSSQRTNSFQLSQIS